MLHLAGTYVRDVAASRERIRENVLDWEHLPALHAGSFAAVELIDADAAGWRIRLSGHGGGTPRVLKLDLAADTSTYRVVTETGPGAGSEIRVAVTSRGGAAAANVVVEYHVPEADPARLAAIGRGFVAVYTRLWDEDEAMMQARAAALARRVGAPAPSRLDLGAEAQVRARLPIDFDLASERFRLVDLGDGIVAHAATCPHWLGPLDAAPDGDGCVTCPWHGYRFDVRSGRSADGRGLRLARAPSIAIAGGRVLVTAAGA